MAACPGGGVEPKVVVVVEAVETIETVESERSRLLERIAALATIALGELELGPLFCRDLHPVIDGDRIRTMVRAPVRSLHCIGVALQVDVGEPLAPHLAQVDDHRIRVRCDGSGGCRRIRRGVETHNPIDHGRFHGVGAQESVAFELASAEPQLLDQSWQRRALAGVGVKTLLQQTPELVGDFGGQRELCRQGHGGRGIAAVAELGAEQLDGDARKGVQIGAPALGLFERFENTNLRRTESIVGVGVVASRDIGQTLGVDEATLGVDEARAQAGDHHRAVVAEVEVGGPQVEEREATVRERRQRLRRFLEVADQRLRSARFGKVDQARAVDPLGAQEHFAVRRVAPCEHDRQRRVDGLTKRRGPNLE